MENNKCTECGAYNNSHSPRCSLIALDEAKEQLVRYYELWLAKEIDTRKRIEQSEISNKRKVDAIKKDRDIFKGKYFTVKEENNKLRKKLIL